MQDTSRLRKALQYALEIRRVVRLPPGTLRPEGLCPLQVRRTGGGASHNQHQRHRPRGRPLGQPVPDMVQMPGGLEVVAENGLGHGTGSQEFQGLPGVAGNLHPENMAGEFFGDLIPPKSAVHQQQQQGRTPVRPWAIFLKVIPPATHLEQDIAPFSQAEPTPI